MKYKFATDPASDAEITAFESEAKVSLPEDYRAFLLEVNGGRPDRERFATRWSGQSFASRYILSTASELFGLRDDEGFDLRDEIDSYGERIPASTIPIGRDPGGNLILMSVAGENVGSIHYWAYEHEVDFDGGVIPDFSNVALIAPSFSAFLDALEADD